MDHEELKLHRISIQIFGSQYQKLKNASRPGISISSLIRDSIDSYFLKVDDNAAPEENISTNLNTSMNVNPSSEKATALNLEAELNQLENIKNKELITSEEYLIMRKNLLGL